MTIKYHRTFKKHFRARIAPNPQLAVRFEERLLMKLQTPNNPLLYDHQLKGKKASYRAFAVTGDIRVVYKIDNNVLLLYDIGTHNQVY